MKASLKDVRRDYARKRTKEAATFIGEFCDRQKEDKLDLLYFLLSDDLKERGDSRYKEVLTNRTWGAFTYCGGKSSSKSSQMLHVS